MLASLALMARSKCPYQVLFNKGCSMFLPRPYSLLRIYKRPESVCGGCTCSSIAAIEYAAAACAWIGKSTLYPKVGYMVPNKLSAKYGTGSSRTVLDPGLLLTDSREPIFTDEIWWQPPGWRGLSHFTMEYSCRLIQIVNYFYGY